MLLPVSTSACMKSSWRARTSRPRTTMLEFPDGRTVLLTFLCEGQVATVLQQLARPMMRPWKMPRDASATWADSTGQRFWAALWGAAYFFGRKRSAAHGGGKKYAAWTDGVIKRLS